MTESDLINIISDNGDRYGDLLLKCMDRFGKENTHDLTYDELLKFIKEEKILSEDELKKYVRV